jgi:hypothetical protein
MREITTDHRVLQTFPQLAVGPVVLVRTSGFMLESGLGGGGNICQLRREQLKATTNGQKIIPDADLKDGGRV